MPISEMNTIVIALAREEDLDAIIALEQLCFPANEAASPDTIKERFQQFPECFLVAKRKGEVLGFINGACSDAKILEDAMYHDATLHNEEGKYQCVFGLDVHPDYQRQKIASKLLAHFISLAKAYGRKGMVLTCKSYLIPFYESFDFKCLGVSKSTHGDSEWNDMLLTW